MRRLNEMIVLPRDFGNEMIKTLTDILRSIIAQLNLLARDDSGGVLEVTAGGTGTADSNGFYMPNITAIANVADSTPNYCSYIRVGNCVTLAGVLSITPTAANTETSWAITLFAGGPVAGDWACAGAGQMQGTNYTRDVGIKGESSDSTAVFRTIPGNTAAAECVFTLTYRLVA